jgi:hypothetical protein
MPIEFTGFGKKTSDCEDGGIYNRVGSNPVDLGLESKGCR